MTFDEMAALPIGDIGAKNCPLIMWVVGSHIDESLRLGKAWGFKPITDAFYWFKEKLINADQIDLFTGDVPPPGIGMGYWTRKQVEPAFLFTKGKPKCMANDVRQAIIEPRREHSRKPDAQYERIERLVAGPYLEIFGRNQRPGWDVWGNQVGKFGVAA
jgi:N6-adenosine-specific RNA methylase IME4